MESVVSLLSARSLVTSLIKKYYTVSIPNVWGMIGTLVPRVCGHELLEPSVTWREKSM